MTLGLPFAPIAMSTDWLSWPSLTDLFPIRFHGVLTNRDAFLVDLDSGPLKDRIADYFNPNLTHEEVARRYPRVMRPTAEFNATKVRDTLLKRGGPDELAFVRFTYRPFDTRWLYWERDTKLVERTRADYRPQVFEGNLWLSAAQHLRQDSMEPQAFFRKDPRVPSLDRTGCQHVPRRIFVT